ncbi:ANK1 [Symbiodinium pilosum]|uniref:ANK1 protein n=1 Tax=Symbiodinium pilosum TaxID=2952 RepID=A0A812SAD9_SYMPI|nr:ANK1 [Symbiodinium pilosum]
MCTCCDAIQVEVCSRGLATVVTKAHYYCIVTLFKNCILAFVPVIFQRGVAFQSCLLGFSIVLFMMHQQQVQPWKSNIANQLDGICSAALLSLLLCGTLATPTNLSIVKDLQIAGTAVVCLLGVFLIGGLGYSLYRLCVPGKHYKWFICHHKADASAQARLLKMLLQAG